MCAARSAASSTTQGGCGRTSTMRSMLEVLHVDDAIVVIDKPAGLLAVPGRGEFGRDNAASRVQQRCADALIVHRLDMATSGLLLFARGAQVHRDLSAAFAKRRVHKRYVAVVHGVVEADQGEIAAPLAADWPNRPRQIVDVLHGKPSLTRWRVLARDASTTRLELEPVTGRSHQLRVHLLSIGHPICGDPLYGALPPATPRLLLHACELGLTHPLTGAACRFVSEAPF
jgi:tRNA pseudouridine32 synthase/23S rRNA pseudouridine746 synthase